jgi:hypothetical protein
MNGIKENAPPDFVNVNGSVKWWKCPILNEWAHKETKSGPPMPNVLCWLVEEAAVHLDIMKLDKTCN